MRRPLSFHSLINFELSGLCCLSLRRGFPTKFHALAELRISDPLPFVGGQSMLTDFCAAHYNAPERDIIRAALDFFVQNRLDAEPEMRKRFEDARRRRLGLSDSVVRIVPKED